MNRRRLHSFALFVACCTFILIIAGALVTSTGSGLAVPDWPLSYGQYFPPMKGGILFEHGHRMIAGTVGLLMVALAACVLVWEPRRWVRWLAAAAVLSVFLQALLGGMTVLYGLPPWVSVGHAVLGQTFFCLTVILALVTSRAWEEAPAEISPDTRRLFPAWIATVALLYAQLVFGAGSRHGAGGVFLKMHLMNSGAVAGAVLAVFFTVWKRHRNIRELFLPASAGAVILLVQISLGLLSFLPMVGVNAPSWLMEGHVPLVTAHVAVGALLLATSVAGTIWSGRFSKPRRAAAPNAA